MAINEYEVPGADPFNYYLRNYDYTSMLSDLPTLSIMLVNELDRLFYKNYLGGEFKIMVDASTDKNLADGFVMVTSDGGKANVSSITDTELSALSGIDSNIQDQIDEITNWTLEVKTKDFTAGHKVSYSINTTTGQVNVTVPDAVDGTLFETQFLKSTDLTTADVVVSTVSGQLIGGKTSQTISGSNESFWIKSVGTEYEIFQDARNKLQDDLSRSTTILSGFEVTQASATTVDVSAGVAGINDPTSEDKSVTVRFAGVTGLVIDALATRGFTILGFNPGTGLIDQHVETQTQEHQINHPQVGLVLHSYGDGTILAAATWWTVGQNPSTRHSTLLDFFKVLKDGVNISPVAGGNTVSVSVGKFLSSGLNGDENAKSPDLRPIYSLSESLLYTYVDRNTTIGSAPSATVDYSQWDNNGVLTLTGSQKWYNYRVYIPVSGVADNLDNQFLPVIWQYAQNEYNSSDDAKLALTTGDDSFTVMPKLPGISALCAIVTVRGGAANLDTAFFRQTDMFGGIANSAGGAVVGGLLEVLSVSTSAGGLYKITDLVNGAAGSQDAMTVKQGENTFVRVSGQLFDVNLNNKKLDNVSDITSNGDIKTTTLATSTGSTKLTSGSDSVHMPSLFCESEHPSIGFLHVVKPTSTATGFGASAYVLEARREDDTPITTGSIYQLKNNSDVLVDVDSNGVATLPESTPVLIAAAGAKAVVTNEVLGELKITVAPSATVNVTGTATGFNDNSFNAYIADVSSNYIYTVTFGTQNQFGSQSTTLFAGLATITNGVSFTNPSGTSEMSVTIKALGKTDITQLTVSS
jgi:hypothetical protein